MKGDSSSPKISYFWAILCGLLSSSCCVIQLILNIFSVGCAGFSLLTPYRLVFLSFTAILITTTIFQYGLLSKRTLITIFISVLLSISPEVVSRYNQSNISSMPMSDYSNKQVEIFVLQINGISCEGCANRIKNHFDAQPHVIYSKVYFKNQSAIIGTFPGIYEAKDVLTWVKMIDFKYDGKVIQQYIVSKED
ncbi:15854_t:CDS:1 [Dentiscutata erythropus]|uniref:15854_t:CDS:1 n=1 Tax=Dentiscutata erythropus TaxID=1348616 RepID=A0A9N9B3F8_9GLOM|nr:15854_t:CDS:1 [Dentiscutata erythropus]